MALDRDLRIPGNGMLIHRIIKTFHFLGILLAVATFAGCKPRVNMDIYAADIRLVSQGGDDLTIPARLKVP